MIKLIYDEPKYFYNDRDLSQPYDIHTEIELDKDITADEAIEAFIHFLRCAGYRYVGKQTLERVIERYYH